MKNASKYEFHPFVIHVRQLWEAAGGKKGGSKALALRFGVSFTTIDRWRDGSTNPDLVERSVFLAVMGLTDDPTAPAQLQRIIPEELDKAFSLLERIYRSRKSANPNAAHAWDWIKGNLEIFCLALDAVSQDPPVRAAPEEDVAGKAG